MRDPQEPLGKPFSWGAISKHPEIHEISDSEVHNLH